MWAVLKCERKYRLERGKSESNSGMKYNYRAERNERENQVKKLKIKARANKEMLEKQIEECLMKNKALSWSFTRAINFVSVSLHCQNTERFFD